MQGRVSYSDLWALREVDVSVMRGEVIGVIGANAAGKSTLLQLIARVLHPTNGRVRVRGIVAPLLEVGAGFHPDLSGRENIYLNATLLGRSHAEVDDRFSWIVDFSELAEFIDAPLRTYSSGMWARLGFSVATAWEPDVLLLDEILSVGDERFRHKSEERIATFRRHGITVVLVSHNLVLIEGICDRAIWLERGTIRGAGYPGEIAARYRDQSLSK